MYICKYVYTLICMYLYLFFMYVSMCVCMYAGKNVCMKYNTIFKTVTASCMYTWEMVLCCPPQSSTKGWACLPPIDLPPSLLCQRGSIPTFHGLPCPTPKNSETNHQICSLNMGFRNKFSIFPSTPMVKHHVPHSSLVHSEDVVSLNLHLDPLPKGRGEGVGFLISLKSPCL